MSPELLVGELDLTPFYALLREDLTVQDALDTMFDSERMARCVFVSDYDTRALKGLVTESDLIHQKLFDRSLSLETPLSEIIAVDSLRGMSRDGTAVDAVNIMTKGGFHQIPITREVELDAADEVNSGTITVLDGAVDMLSVLRYVLEDDPTYSQWAMMASVSRPGKLYATNPTGG